MYNFFHFPDHLKLQIETAAYLDVNKEWKKMVEAFSYIRIYYVRSGTAVLQLIDKTLDMEEGYLYFIPAFSIVGGSCDYMGHYFIHLVPDALTGYFIKTLKLKQKVRLERDVADYLFITLAQKYKEETIRSCLTVNSVLKLIFSYFIDDSAMLEQSDLSAQRFLPVLEYIDQHISKKLYVKELAALIYLDDIYFSNLFKKQFGVSVQQYILDKKLDKAKALLATDMPIQNIAETLNFYDTASFTRFFKKKTASTPKEFRNRFFRIDR